MRVLRNHVCMICGKSFKSTGNAQICGEKCAKERNRIWHKNRRAGFKTRRYLVGVNMSLALDEHGCDIVCDFFAKLLRASEMAEKHRIPVTVDAISSLMSMYRAREI